MSVDLRTSYMGLSLRHPVIAAASPLTGDLDGLRRLEDAGVAAAVLPSLFEEQLEHEARELAKALDHGSDAFSEALSYLPEQAAHYRGPDAYLEHLAAAKEALAIPVIASLNGRTTGGWVGYARRLAEAGADGLELNVYFVPTDPSLTGADVERRYVELVRAVRAAVDLPLAVKVGPYFSSMLHMATQLAAAGADALVLFNRFLYPDFDLDSLKVEPRLELSISSELRMALQWVAILKGRVEVSLAASGGAHQADDAVKLVLAGADVVQLASSLLVNGPGHAKTVVSGLQAWLERRDYASVEQAKGSMSQERGPDSMAFERANYMRALTSYSRETP